MGGPRTQMCATCIYFCQDPDDQYEEGHGDCRRYPPTMVGEASEPGITFSDFPSVSVTQWCGEWRQNEDVEHAPYQCTPSCESGSK